jgi:hypothetical protein
MAPHSQAATAGKRKKADKPGKALAVKSTNPVSKKTHKQNKPRPAAAAAAADEPAGGGVLLSAALPPARQLEFFLRSFERAAKMRLSPLELAAYSGTYVRIHPRELPPLVPAPAQFDSASLCARLAGL